MFQNVLKCFHFFIIIKRVGGAYENKSRYDK